MQINFIPTLLLILLMPHLLLADEKYFNGKSELTYKCGDEGYILITYKKNETLLYNSEGYFGKNSEIVKGSFEDNEFELIAIFTYEDAIGVENFSFYHEEGVVYDPLIAFNINKFTNDLSLSILDENQKIPFPLTDTPKCIVIDKKNEINLDKYESNDSDVQFLNEKEINEKANQTKLNHDELKLILSDCWSIPLGIPYDKRLIVKVKVSFNNDGTFSTQPKILDPEIMDKQLNKYFKVLADSVLRSLLRCFPNENLDFSKYNSEQLSNIQLNFDPSESLR